MGVEIEHKYLLKDDSYRDMSISCTEIQQGYLSRDPERVVRIRIAGEKAYITIKGLTKDGSRPEYEYPIPMGDALALLGLCQPPVIRKRRYKVPYGDYLWEIDEFLSPVSFTLAEIELPDAEAKYPLPSFIGDDVTGVEKYFNSNIK